MCEKILTLMGIFVLILLIGTPLHGSEQNTPLSASVSVNSVFRLSMSPSAVLDFGSADPGTTTARKSVTLACDTNDNTEWYISVYVQSPLNSGQYDIPNSNFKWELATTNGTGRATPSGEISTAPRDIYTAGMNDFITETPVDLTLTLYIDIPTGQPAGRYVTTVFVTLHE